MDKTILIISGGMEAVPGIRRAKEMGLHVAVSDMDPAAPGFALADDCIIASTYDTEATVTAALKYHKETRPIDGVMCMASDVPLTVAMVADALGLPGIPVDTARRASDKILMKQCFAEHEIAIPWFSEIASVSELEGIIAERAVPVVIKPVDSRGARGVLRLTRSVDLNWAFDHSVSYSPSKRVMVEEYIDGRQISTESILQAGDSITLGFADRNYDLLEPYSPYIIENGGHQPSVLDESVRREVSDLAVRAGRALGVRTGIVKGDMVYTERGPKVIEVATRLSGGWFSTDQIPLATGVDFIGAAIRLSLGEVLNLEDLQPRCQKGVAIRYFFPEPGVVTDVLNVEKFRNVPWVHRIMIFVKRGDIVGSVTDHTKRAGCVITVGDTRQEALRRAEMVVDTVQIKTVPSTN